MHLTEKAGERERKFACKKTVENKNNKEILLKVSFFCYCFSLVVVVFGYCLNPTVIIRFRFSLYFLNQFSIGISLTEMQMSFVLTFPSITKKERKKLSCSSLFPLAVKCCKEIQLFVEKERLISCNF